MAREKHEKTRKWSSWNGEGKGVEKGVSFTSLLAPTVSHITLSNSTASQPLNLTTSPVKHQLRCTLKKTDAQRRSMIRQTCHRAGVLTQGGLGCCACRAASLTEWG
jgi:hypothetical protein